MFVADLARNTAGLLANDLSSMAFRLPFIVNLFFLSQLRRRRRKDSFKNIVVQFVPHFIEILVIGESRRNKHEECYPECVYTIFIETDYFCLLGIDDGGWRKM